MDDEGNIWIEDYNRPGDTKKKWTVFDRAGIWLGGLQFPDRFTPTHIGNYFVLGFEQDLLDVEYVQLYDLIKPIQ